MSNVLCYRCALTAGAAWLAAFASHGQLTDPIPEPVTPGSIAIELDLVAGGMTAPNLLTHAGDGTGNRYIVDQAGQVRVLSAGGTLQASPLLDISDVLSGLNSTNNSPLPEDLGLRAFFDERGLLGLAFHPQFATPGAPGEGLLYTYSSQPVTRKADFTSLVPGDPLNHQSVVTEWRLDSTDPTRVDPASARELMRIDEPQFNHNAGMIAFSPTDTGGPASNPYLYIAVGDGGAANDLAPGHVPGGNGQDPSNVLGTLLRIDPLGSNSASGRYGVPASNPFVGDAGIVDEVYAYGLRNPFRFSFDRADGRLVVADVGQGNLEEVNLVAGGENFGWPIKEGSFYFDPETGEVSDTPFPGQVDPGDLVDPVVEYDHDEGISIIGGFVYRGSAIPELVGKYVFGDFSSAFNAADGRLFYADLDTGEIHELVIGEGRDLGLFVKGFGEDEQGELYLLAGPNLGPTGADGAVYQIVPIPEPATALLLVSAAGLVLLRRKREP